MKKSCLNCYRKLVEKDGNSSMIFSKSKMSSSGPPPVNAAVRELRASMESTAERPLVFDTPDNSLPGWAEAILLVQKNSAFPDTVCRVAFPEDCLSQNVLDDIFDTALPKQLRGSKESELRFVFRVRDKKIPGEILRDKDDNGVGFAVGKTTTFYNCYVIYHQKVVGTESTDQTKSPVKGETKLQLIQQAVVLVSKWPFPQLAFQLLAKLDDACCWQATGSTSSDSEIGAKTVSTGTWKEFDSTGMKTDSGAPEEPSSPSPLSPEGKVTRNSNDGENEGSDSPGSMLQNVLMTAFAQIGGWPLAVPGTQMYLHFFGELIQYTVPGDMLETFGANLSWADVFSSVNLISLLGPLGLVQHAWVLWELLVTGQDIVVVAPTPTQCAEVVLALGSILLPLAHVGDFRPYMRPDDSDLQVLATTAYWKRVHRNKQQKDNTTGFQMLGTVGTADSYRWKSMIVGVTDMEALAKLESFSAALFLSPIDGPQGYIGANPDVIFKGLRTKNAAPIFYMDSNSVPSTSKGGKRRSFLDSSSNAGKSFNSSKFVDYFGYWVEEDSQRSMLVSRQETSAISIKKVLVRIKKMHPHERNILGDKVLRDNLKELTTAFLKPSTYEGVGLEDANRRESQLLRTEVEGEMAKKAELAAMQDKNVLVVIIHETMDWLRALPQFVTNNVPTAIMWVGLMFGFVLLRLMGLPPVMLIGGALIMKIPDRAPREFEALLETFIPAAILYPTKHEVNTVPSAARNTEVPPPETSTVAVSGETSSADSPKVDLSGVWKRTRLENYENLLGAQGAGYVQRKLGASMAMTHTVTMSEDCMVFRLQEKGGPIDTDFTYFADGPEIPTKIMKSNFLDKLTWEGGRLKLRKLRLPDKGSELILYRSLEDDGKTLKAEAICNDLTGKNPSVVAFTYFELQGPSPNPKPASITKPVEKVVDESFSKDGGNQAAVDVLVSATNTKANSETGNSLSLPRTMSVIKRKDYSGTWQRTKAVNFEAFIGAAGAGYMQRKIAASIPMTHLITMDPLLQAFRLQEKGGPINTDCTLVVGGEFQPGVVNGKNFLQRVYWTPDGSLVMQRRLVGGAYDLIMTRSIIDDNEDEVQILLISVNRNHNTGKEVESTAWFTRIGDSPNPAPEFDRSLLPAPEPSKADEAAKKKDMAIEELNGVDADPQQAVDAEADALLENDEDIDLEDEDDDAALERLRQFSAARRSNFAAHIPLSSPKTIQRQTIQRMTELADADILADARDALSADPLDLSTLSENIESEVKPDMTGKWARSSALNGSNKSQNTLAYQLNVTHDLACTDMGITIKEVAGSGSVLDEVSYVYDADFKTITRRKKEYQSRCYWEGTTLVEHSVNQLESYELILKRDLEQEGEGEGERVKPSEGSIIRLVTIRRNLITGQESESMAIFKFVVDGETDE